MFVMENGQKPNERVSDFAIRLQTEALRLGVSDNTLINAFISGLKPSIRMHVTSRKLDKNFQQILECVLIDEVSAPATLENQPTTRRGF